MQTPFQLPTQLKDKMNTAVIGVGSNINPEDNIKHAKQKISSKVKLIRSSSFVKTEPIGFKNQDNFCNGAFLVETVMKFEKFEAFLKKVEIELGRTKNVNKDRPRTIDLDIVVWNNKVVDKEVYDRAFLKNSIIELIPDFEF